MNGKDYRKLLAPAVYELYRAVEEMHENTFPRTSIPRPRSFEFAPGLFWPPVYDGRVDYRYINTAGCGVCRLSNDSAIAREIVNACGGRPRKILRALRRIQAATAWCRARTEGRKRMAEEILRQQAKAVTVSEAEAVMVSLKK